MAQAIFTAVILAILAGVKPLEQMYRDRKQSVAFCRDRAVDAILLGFFWIRSVKTSWDPALFGYKLETGDNLTFDECDSVDFAAMPGEDRPQGRPGSRRLSTNSTFAAA